MKTLRTMMLLLMLSCALPYAWAQDSGVTITVQGTDRTIIAPNYTATVAKDGCLTSLKLGQDEYLAPGIDISRGIYIVQGGGTVSLSAISQPSHSEIDAVGDKAAFKYVFARDSVVVNHVGVGEVFVIAGQSNSTNYGETRTTSASGMVSSFSGSAWQLANDPQPGTHDNSTGGSPWPTFGDALYARYHVPIAIASTGYGGTSVNQWQPDGDLFNFTMTRIHELGPHGFRALLWHQGESDIRTYLINIRQLKTAVSGACG